MLSGKIWPCSEVTGEDLTDLPRGLETGHGAPGHAALPPLGLTDSQRRKESSSAI